MQPWPLLGLIHSLCLHSVRLREQTRELRPTSGPKAGAAASGPFWSSSSQRCASAGGPGLRGLHVSALHPAALSAEPVAHRGRGHPR